jgi:hypothetical protein
LVVVVVNTILMVFLEVLEVVLVMFLQVKSQE